MNLGSSMLILELDEYFMARWNFRNFSKNTFKKIFEVISKNLVFNGYKNVILYSEGW